MGLLIFSSCQNDDFGVERGNTNESILIVRKKFSDFKKLPSLAEKALSRSNVLDRGNSTDPLYDFQIDSTSVTQAQKDGHTYYTMAIFRPISTEESFENLVVSDDAQQAYIFKYYPSEDYLQKKMWMQHPQYSGSVNITEIDYNELSSRGNCVSITLFFCGNGPPGTPAGDCCYASAEDDGAGDGGAHVTTRTYEVCSDEDLYITQIVTDPSPGSSNGGGGGAGGGGGGTQTPGSYPVSPVKPTPADPNSPLDPLTDPNENPVLTEPLIILVRPQTPCKQLNDLKTKSNFTTKMNILKAGITGTKEKGFLLKDVPNNEASEIIESVLVNGGVTYPWYDIPINDLYKNYGTGHNHLQNNPKNVGIFTPEDVCILQLTGLIETASQNPYRKDSPEKSIALLITTKGLFAIKINDLSKLNVFAQNYQTWSQKDMDDYVRDFLQNPAKYNIRPTSTHDEQVTGFLRFIKDKDLGIDLYEGNTNGFGDWNKLTLLENSSGIFSYLSEPCN